MSNSSRRADGRLQKAITDEKTGKRVYFYGKTERELNRKILEYERKRERGCSFEEYAEEWLGDALDTLANQSLAPYRAAYGRILDEFKGEPICDITPRDIDRFLKKLADKRLAYKTVSNHKTILNQIFTRAVIDGEIPYNPCTSVKVPKGLPRTVRPPASEDDERKIIESDHPFLLPLIGLCTGLRRGEILALRWRDIDFNNNLIRVTSSVEHVGDKPQLKAPKTEAGVRVVPLLDILKAKLAPVAAGKPIDNFVISDDGKNPHTKRRCATLLKHYKEEVGVSCTPHQLRHSYATIAVGEDVSFKSLQATLGHADAYTTINTYASVRLKDVIKVGNEMNSYFNKNAPQKP
jgi:integrase